MKYITGIHALNLPCDLATCGDWHTSALHWKDIFYGESDTSPLGEWGIELNKNIPNHTETYAVANHIRALLDLLLLEYYPIAQGMREDFICNESYTHLIFEKVTSLKQHLNWEKVNDFMVKEYKADWIEYIMGNEHAV